MTSVMLLKRNKAIHKASKIRFAKTRPAFSHLCSRARIWRSCCIDVVLFLAIDKGDNLLYYVHMLKRADDNEI